MGKFFGTEPVFKMKIWLNGKFVEEDEAKVDITSSGFLYGQGKTMGSAPDIRH